MVDRIGEEARPGSAIGGVRALLRLEGAALALSCIVGYAWLGESWLIFAVLILAPDLSFLAFLAGARAGVIAYDAMHTTVGPLILGVVGVAAGSDPALGVALIWGVHIGVDRAIGYGLKYPSALELTHLGPRGRMRAGTQ